MWRWILVLLLCVSVSGCAVNLYSGRPSDKEKIGKLSDELARLERERQQERRELQSAMDMLDKKLRREIDNKDVSLQMLERGLVITFVAEVLFDSGKAKIKEEAIPVLKKMADILKEKVGDKNIGVEGHTDNEPIQFSSWKSNWDLSAARATSVLHFLLEEGRLVPDRLSAIGYGEYRPIASNDTPEGRAKNRRVEIVIMPKVTKERILSEQAKANKIRPIK